jgi:hypothetical protein
MSSEGAASSSRPRRFPITDRFYAVAVVVISRCQPHGASSLAACSCVAVAAFCREQVPHHIPSRQQPLIRLPLMRLARSGAEATILTSLTRSWKMIANQTDRYVVIIRKEAAQKTLTPLRNEPCDRMSASQVSAPFVFKRAGRSPVLVQHLRWRPV